MIPCPRELRWSVRFSLLVLIFGISVHAAWAETLKIGYIGALTGDSAMIGNEIVRSLQTSIAQLNRSGGINGDKLELVVEDDGYVVARSLTAYERLKSVVNSRVIFMSTYGGLFALGKRPETDGIVIVDTLDCNDALVKTSTMHTCVATRTESIGEAFLERIASQGGGRVGVLYEEEAWFNFIVNTLRSGLKEQLVEIVVPVSAADYRAEVLKLKASGVQHVVFLGNDSMGRAFDEARRIGIKAPFYSIASVTSPGFRRLAGDSLEGTYVSNWLIPRNSEHKKFSEEFKALHGADITLDFVVGPTHDAMMLVANALRGSREPTEIRRALSSQEAFAGISGEIKMDLDGAVRSIREQLFVLRSGELTPAGNSSRIEADVRADSRNADRL